MRSGLLPVTSVSPMLDRAGGRLEHPGDRQHERALAGAVRPEQGGDLAGRDLDRHTAQHRTTAARHVQIVDGQRQAHASTSTSSVPM